MGDLAIGLGVFLAICGPLLVVPITWVLYRFAVRRLLARLLQQRISELSLRLASLAAAVVIIAAILAASYLPGKRDFDRLCSENATPRVVEQVFAEGFFRTQLFPYEAGMYLNTFSFVEAPDPYRDEVMVRYFRDGDDVKTVEVTKLSSRYGVEKRFMEMAHGITMTEKRIFELSTSRELARAVSANYQGGPLGLLLGASGRSSCPDPRSEQGSRDFGVFYDLETKVLRSSRATH